MNVLWQDPISEHIWDGFFFSPVKTCHIYKPVITLWLLFLCLLLFELEYSAFSTFHRNLFILDFFSLSFLTLRKLLKKFWQSKNRWVQVDWVCGMCWFQLKFIKPLRKVAFWAQISVQSICFQGASMSVGSQGTPLESAKMLRVVAHSALEAKVLSLCLVNFS